MRALRRFLKGTFRPLLDRNAIPEPIWKFGRRLLTDRVGALEDRIADRERRIAELEDRRRMLQRLVILDQPTAALPALPGSQRDGPMVSVIMPTCNRADIVGDAIRSVQRQTFSNWELMLVDDGSTDGTRESITPFLADSRIRYLRQDRAGSSAARNLGIDRSTAELITYLDDDNIWFPDFLYRAVECLNAEPETDFVYGAFLDETDQEEPERIVWEPFDRARLLLGNFIDTNCIAHRRTLVDRYGGWDADLLRLTDWDLALRYTVDKPARPLPTLAVRYREVDAQRISRVRPAVRETERILRKWTAERSALRA